MNFQNDSTKKCITSTEKEIMMVLLDKVIIRHTGIGRDMSEGTKHGAQERIRDYNLAARVLYIEQSHRWNPKY
jgi:hypothetical protein